MPGGASFCWERIDLTMPAKRKAIGPTNTAPDKTPASSSLAGYDDLLHDLKERIRAAQVRAALAVNRELVLLYWLTGRDILERQRQQGWGAKVIDRLASDLRSAFPDMKGFSPRNLKIHARLRRSLPG